MVSKIGLLAQRLEQWTHNPLVAGSNPAGPTLFLMKSWKIILLLVVSNVFMTLAWYGHLKLKQFPATAKWGLLAIILFSWGLAFFEYCFQVPANKFGFMGNGGPFSLIQLRILQEVISLFVFTVIVALLFRGESFTMNHVFSFLCLVGAVFFAFRK